MTSISAAPRSKRSARRNGTGGWRGSSTCCGTVVAFDHLYIGGGNAKYLKLDLPGRRIDRPEPVRADRRVRAVARHRRGPSGERRKASGPSSGRRPPSMPRTPVGFEVPDCACDCHVHVFGTAAQFPFADPRSYTPPPASADELAALLQRLNLWRVVIVQPSVYGTDNSCTLDGMRRLGPAARARRRGDRRQYLGGRA